MDHMLKRRWPSLVVFLLLCFSVAAAASWVTIPQVASWYPTIAKPAWRPPDWLFGPVWTVLYAMIAVAGWRVWCANARPGRSSALIAFAVQLALNLCWSPVFFGLHNIRLALAIIVALWFAIGMFFLLSWKVDRVASWLFLPYWLWVTFATALNFSIWRLNPGARVAVLSLALSTASLLALAANTNDGAVAKKLSEAVAAGGYPSDSAWQAASPIAFHSDWQGKNPDPGRSTEVRLLWNADTLFLRFVCRYRTLTVFDNAEPNGRLVGLWDRDVAEVFLQPDASQLRRYFEFEVSPNGFWIDLDIEPGKKDDPKSGMRRRVVLDEPKKIWTADVAIPLASLDPKFDPTRTWKVNFFRVEGETEPRFYSSWRPTNTPQPQFHVPEAFAPLRFLD